MTRRCEHATEAILIAMACLSPWAFGAVEAWAELGLDVGVALLAVCWAFGGRRPLHGRGLSCLPGLALGGLVVFALIQASPLTDRGLRVLSPGTARLRASLIPRAAERVGGDPLPPVSLPAATLSQDPEATIHAALWLAAAWIVFQCALGLSDGPGALRRFSRCFAANAAVLALFSLFQALFWNGKIYGWRASPYGSAGPFVSHNHLSAYLNLGLGLALGWLAAGDRTRSPRRERGRRLWAAYAAGLIVSGVVISLSRSGFLGLGAGLIGLFLMLRPRGLRPWMALGTAAVLVPVFLVVVGRAAPYQQRLASLLESSSYAERLQIWCDAVRAWPHSPIWGTGLGSFSVAAAPFFRHATGVRYVHAENEYVEWLVEGGLLGVGLAGLFLVGVVRLGRRAWAASTSNRERTLILGGAFGGISLLVQSGGDFAPHIPAVGISALILTGLVARIGLECEPPAPSFPAGSRPRGGRWLVAELGMALLGLIVLAHGARWARAEAGFLGAGLDLRDNEVLLRSRDRLNSPDGSSLAASPELTRLQGALEQALRMRPDWAEGHLRLGLIHLHGYEQAAVESLASSMEDPKTRGLLANPLWLHDVIHSTPEPGREPIGELAAFEPIREHLIPAARSFLEARRCCPVMALPHAELATVDYLLEGGDPGPVYVERALRLAGANAPLIALATQLAVQEGDPDLAARGLRQSLETHALDWTEVADLASGILPPDRILQDVVPDSRSALGFADRLFSAPEDREIRGKFLRSALQRLPREPGLSPAARLELEAQLLERLGQPGPALRQLEAALALEPRRTGWRKDLVVWLIARGELRQAHDQAMIGLSLTPDQPEARQALNLAADALARGKPPGPPGDPEPHAAR
jgi:O-antigen ligase